MVDYTKLSVKKELMDKIQKFIEDYPELGYRSLAEFVEDAARRRAEELRVFELTPRFEHFNTYGDHATIRDNKLGLYIDLYPQENGTILCKHCETTDCEHVKFALTVAEIIEPLEKHGWQYKG